MPVFPGIHFPGVGGSLMAAATLLIVLGPASMRQSLPESSPVPRPTDGLRQLAQIASPAVERQSHQEAATWQPRTGRRSRRSSESLQTEDQPTVALARQPSTRLALLIRGEFRRITSNEAAPLDADSELILASASLEERTMTEPFAPSETPLPPVMAHMASALADEGAAPNAFYMQVLAPKGPDVSVTERPALDEAVEEGGAPSASFLGQKN